MQKILCVLYDPGEPVTSMPGWSKGDAMRWTLTIFSPKLWMHLPELWLVNYKGNIISLKWGSFRVIIFFSNGAEVLVSTRIGNISVQGLELNSVLCLPQNEIHHSYESSIEYKRVSVHQYIYTFVFYRRYESPTIWYA